MNQLATVEVIHSFEPHTNADSLELAKVLGFQVVVKKDQFKHGDKVVFVWPDTICAPADWNKFLDKNNQGKPIRIKSCKLRGEFSTGLVLPYSVLDAFTGKDSTEIGEEVAVPLNVIKYVKDEGGGNNGESGGTFPSEYISKTDENLAQSVMRTREDFIGEEVYCSMKIDGQSLTFVRYNGDIKVCSRNQEIKDSDNKFWNTVRKYGILEKTEGMNIAIQGEQYGPGIQKNPLGVSEISFAVFNIKDLDTGKYHGFNEMCDFCGKTGIPLVPILKTFKFEETTSYDDLQKYADTLKYPTNAPAEGFVMRPVVSKYSRALHGGLSVKFINRNYKD